MTLPSRDFTNQVTEKTALVLWIDSSDLSVETPGFVEMDYLCDGLIAEVIKNNLGNALTQNTFHSFNFGHKFFISFFKTHSSLLADIDDVMGLLNPKADLRETVLIAGKKELSTISEILPELNKRYKNFDFSIYQF